MQNKLDPYTFGSEEASKILAKLLNETEQNGLKRKIGKIISRFTTASTEITLSGATISKNHQIMLLDLWFNNCVNLLKENGITPELESFAHNVLKTKYKKYIKCLKENIKKS